MRKPIKTKVLCNKIQVFKYLIKNDKVFTDNLINIPKNELNFN